MCVIFYIAHLGVRYEIYTLAFPFDLRCQSGIYISYAMGTRDLPDIYTLSPQACGPRVSGVYIRQTTRANGITITYNIYIIKYGSTL